jgi:hypothetical protein
MGLRSPAWARASLRSLPTVPQATARFSAPIRRWNSRGAGGCRSQPHCHTTS